MLTFSEATHSNIAAPNRYTPQQPAGEREREGGRVTAPHNTSPYSFSHHTHMHGGANDAALRGADERAAPWIFPTHHPLPCALPAGNLCMSLRAGTVVSAGGYPCVCGGYHSPSGRLLIPLRSGGPRRRLPMCWQAPLPAGRQPRCPTAPTRPVSSRRRRPCVWPAHRHRA